MVLYLSGFQCATADIVDKCVVRVGTLEPASAPAWAYIFRFKGGEELFDMSPNATSIRGVPGIYDLFEAGFKLDNGIKYLHKSEGEGALEKRAYKENPGHKVVAILFRGQGGAILEINLKGQTTVIRVDLKIGNADVTLWSNNNDAEADKRPDAK